MCIRDSINTSFPIIVICDNFHSPENIGMAFRVCENMGVERLYLTGDSPLPPNKRIRKTARTADKYLPSTYHEDIIALLQALKTKGYTLIAIEITDKSESLHQFNFNTHEKIAIILGTERTGISERVLAEVAHAIHIPMFGRLSSMNVIMAMSISLFEISKQLVNKEVSGQTEK